MLKRAKMKKSFSKKLFSRTAGGERVHRKNFSGGVSAIGPMRGGIRL